MNSFPGTFPLVPVSCSRAAALVCRQVDSVPQFPDSEVYASDFVAFELFVGKTRKGLSWPAGHTGTQSPGPQRGWFCLSISYSPQVPLNHAWGLQISISMNSEGSALPILPSLKALSEGSSTLPSPALLSPTLLSPFSCCPIPCPPRDPGLWHYCCILRIKLFTFSSFSSRTDHRLAGFGSGLWAVLEAQHLSLIHI